MEHTILKTKEELVQDGLKSAMGYGDYRQMVAKLALLGKSTGPVQSEELVNYTRLNDRRMRRLDRTIQIDAVSEAKIRAVDKKITWLVLTESWCGDAAQTLPVMQKMAELNKNISFRILLRDENPALMKRFMANGAMAIPKLISIEDTTGKIVGEWGSRPSIARGMVKDYMQAYGKLTAAFKQELQLWYNKDKGQNTVSDLLLLLFLE